MSLVDQILRLASAVGAEAKKLRDRSNHVGTQPVSSITGLQATLNTKVNGVGFTTARAMTQADYDALATKDANTLYFLIKG